MENLRFKMQPETNTQSGSEHSTDQPQVLYAMERARVLFAGYRRGDANDPEGYVASIAAVLSRYDGELIREVTDPRTGISTTDKFQSFMPNSGELKRYCDMEQERKARFQDYANQPKRSFYGTLPRIPPKPGCRAQVFIRAGYPRYAEMVERASKPNADPLDWIYGEFNGHSGIYVTPAWMEVR